MVENDWEALRAWVVQGQVCLVEVAAVQGSAPRACGAWMAVSAQGVMGTIGGGHLEWEATRLAQQWLAQGLQGVPRSHRLALLAAIVLVLAYTPLGYIHIGPLAITPIMIPVTVGAILLGPTEGAILGGIFGLTSFSTCFGSDMFGTTLMGINPEIGRAHV